MSANESDDSDIAKIANQGENSDSDNDCNTKKEKETEKVVNEDIQNEPLIEKKNEFEKQKELASKEIQQIKNKEIAIDTKIIIIEESSKVKEDCEDNNSDDSNIKAIMNQKNSKSSKSDSDSDEEKEGKIKDKITDINTVAKEKFFKDSLIEDKELIQALKEPRQSKDNNNDSNPGNTTLTLNNYKPLLEVNYGQIRNNNDFFKSNNSNNNQFIQQSGFSSSNQQSRGYDNYNRNYQNPSNNANTYKGNQPPYNQNSFYNRNRNYGNNNHYNNYNSNRPQFTSQSDIIENDLLYKENRLLIHKIINCFPSFSDIEIIRIIKTINQGPNQTMFEIMNYIFREHVITKAKKFQLHSQSQRKYENKIDVNETSYPEDLINIHKRIINQYKVYNKAQCIEKKIPEEYAYNSNKDQRRVLKKDIDGHYNYIPRESNNINTQSNPDDFYSINQIEINYHSLVFHTKLCRKRECNELICSNAHSLSSDFRLLYDYKNSDICILMNDISNSKMITVIESYLEHFPIPICFSLVDFKIFKCDLEHKIDRRMCTRYHNPHEKRRPHQIFRYCNESCPNALYNQDYEISRCKAGDYCHMIHSKYEYNYHNDNFQKQYPCNFEQKGHCPFYKTCYGIHKRNYKVDSIDIEFTEASKIISNVILCKICHQLPKNLTYYFYTTCYHYCCKSCLKKSVKEGQKCLFCGVNFAQQTLMKMVFNNK